MPGSEPLRIKLKIMPVTVMFTIGFRAIPFNTLIKALKRPPLLPWCLELIVFWNSIMMKPMGLRIAKATGAIKYKYFTYSG